MVMRGVPLTFSTFRYGWPKSASCAEYTTAGIRGQFNAWLFEQKLLGNLDFIVDVNSVVADTTNPDVFKAGFSYDGTHWGAASTLTVAAYAKTVLLKLEV